MHDPRSLIELGEAAVPNLPDDMMPDGGEADAVEVRRVGQIPSFDSSPRTTCGSASRWAFST